MVVVKKKFKPVVFIFLIGVLLSFFTVSAFADSLASSDQTYFSTYGHDYEGRSFLSIHTSGHTASAGAETGNQLNERVPTGYLAVVARLFNNDDDLIYSTGLQYSDGPAIALQVSTDSSTTKTTYYSQAISGAFNGDGYDYYLVNRTPSLTN